MTPPTPSSPNRAPGTLSFQDGSNDVDTVRTSTDIVRLVGEHLELRAQGREYIGLCPFHDDHKPSMYVVPHKQIYNCFSCGAGGDVFTFMMDYHRMSFREALEELARRAGIELSRNRTTTGDPEQTPRKRVGRANELALSFFQAVLRHESHGAAARALIERRGISDEMVEAFGIGASPDRWDGLLLKAQQSGVSVEDLKIAGLVKSRDSGNGEYDSLRNRLIFPIHDQIGKVVGFGGRRINDEDDPKYLNSPETPVFDKSRTLFGLHLAHRAIKREGVAIVTEGYTDVIACHQAGFTNVVGTLGTSLTKARQSREAPEGTPSLLGHVEILRRVCNTVVLLFDGDEAGQRAADRAAEAFFNESIDVKVATLAAHTTSKDPDELFARENGHAIFKTIIEEAVDVLEHRFSRVRKRVEGLGLSHIEQAMADEIRVLSGLGLKRAAPQRRDLIMNQLCTLTGLSRESVAEAIRGSDRARPMYEAPSRETHAAQEPKTGADVVLACVLTEPKLWMAVKAEDVELIAKGTSSGEGYEVAQTVAKIAGEHRDPGLHAVLDQLRDRPGAFALAQSWAAWIERLTISLGPNAAEENFSSSLERARRATGTSDAGTTQSIIERLAAKQSSHHRDPTKLPRPGAPRAPAQPQANE